MYRSKISRDRIGRFYISHLSEDYVSLYVSKILSCCTREIGPGIIATFSRICLKIRYLINPKDADFVTHLLCYVQKKLGEKFRGIVS